MFANMVGANAHELVLGVPISLIRQWNRCARPEAVENPPVRLGGWQLPFYPPHEGMDVGPYLDTWHTDFHGCNPLPLHVELKLEYAKAAGMSEAEKPPVPTIWHHGGRAYSRDGVKSVVVTVEEHNVLQTFLSTGRAMDTREIENESGATNVSRLIGQLRANFKGLFADAIRTPEGKKGSGGYLIHVRPFVAS